MKKTLTLTRKPAAPKKQLILTKKQAPTQKPKAKGSKYA